MEAFAGLLVALALAAGLTVGAGYLDKRSQERRRHNELHNRPLHQPNLIGLEGKAGDGCAPEPTESSVMAIGTPLPQDDRDRQLATR
jgi:hypothetical protein